MAHRRGRQQRHERVQSVPYARGFKPPSVKASLRAITSSSSKSSLSLHYQPGDSFNPIPAATSPDDWLAQYKEQGQTYDQFLQDCPWTSPRKWKQLRQSFNPHGQTIADRYPEGSIYLLPLGEFDTTSSSHQPRFSALVEYVSIFYGLSVKVMTGVQLVNKDGGVQLVHTPVEKNSVAGRPSRASLRPHIHTMECRYHSPTGHLQLRVNSILTALKQYVPRDAFFVMALTMHDLYDEPPDLFVAGMAAGNHRVGVFSFYRYDPTLSFSQEFWYEVNQSTTVDQTERKKLVLQHSCKLVVHEIAHLLGVDHCIFYECCMNGSGHLAEDFRQPMFLCPVDLHKLQTLCGFDVVLRYKKMAAFFETRGLTKEVEWIRKRLEYIRSA